MHRTKRNGMQKIETRYRDDCDHNDFNIHKLQFISTNCNLSVQQTRGKTSKLGSIKVRFVTRERIRDWVRLSARNLKSGLSVAWPISRLYLVVDERVF